MYVSELEDGSLIAVVEDGGRFNGVCRREGRELARACGDDLDTLVSDLRERALGS